MNALFLWYTALCILSISVIYFAYYMTFVKKKLTYVNWVFIGIGMVLFVQFYSLVQKGIEVNDKLSTEFQVPKEFVSENYNVDSIISDKILYNYLLRMRVKHAKIILIQAKIESANYSSSLFRRNHNMFGMKVSTIRVTTSGYGRAGYKEYINWQESVTDYILWQFSHNSDQLSNNEYIDYLGKIYAEDPKYVSKIKKQLTQINFKKLVNE